MTDRRSTLEMVALTDVGRVRPRNEDSVMVLPGDGWAFLSDGMGGYRGGDVASALAVRVLGEQLQGSAALELDVWQRVDILRAAVEAANAEIFHAASSRPSLTGMGATVVAACFLHGRLIAAHVGDSRLYRYRGGFLMQLTKDHSLFQEQIDRGVPSGEAAGASVPRGLITRALGVDPLVEPDLASLPTQPGDVYLLCSDGLTDMLSDMEIADALSALDGSLGETGRLMIELANERGGRDNISVILVRLGDQDGI